VLTTLVAIVPSAGALFLFWIALRAILQADRRERVAQARIEAEEDRAAARAAAATQPPGAPEPVQAPEPAEPAEASEPS
jgi:threonine/homoserine/homoserine lactone efflux protein